MALNLIVLQIPSPKTEHEVRMQCCCIKGTAHFLRSKYVAFYERIILYIERESTGERRIKSPQSRPYQKTKTRTQDKMLSNFF